MNTDARMSIGGRDTAAVGVLGARMAFDVRLQRLDRSKPRLLGNGDLGGAPFNRVAAVSIFGRLT